MRSSQCGILIGLLAFCGCNETAPNTDDRPIETEPVDSQNEFQSFEVTVTEPNETDLVSFGIGVGSSSANPGDVVTVAVRVKMAPGWHIYAVDRPTAPQIPTSLELSLPDSLVEVGEWDIPEPEPHDGIYWYNGDVVFRKLLRVADSAMAGTMEVKCALNYQVCKDSGLCTPPDSTAVSVNIEIPPR